MLLAHGLIRYDCLVELELLILDHLLQARAVEVRFEDRLLDVQQLGRLGQLHIAYLQCRFYVNYLGRSLQSGVPIAVHTHSVDICRLV